MEWFIGNADPLWNREMLEAATSMVSAGALVFLAVLATVLAIRTGTFGGGRSQANVIVNLEPNPWAINQVDLLVSNLGTAAAYDVEIAFDPPLAAFERQRSTMAPSGQPLRHLSLLRASQLIRANLCQYAEIRDVALSVSVSWKQLPSSRRRKTTSYRLHMADYEGAGYSGAHIT